MRNSGKLASSKSRRTASSYRRLKRSIINSRLGIGLLLAAIIGAIVLLVIVFMREDGDRPNSDPILNNPGRRPQTVEDGPDAFHPVIPTPTPLPGSFRNK